ncbi:MAG TPA: transcriptional regulator GcvA [Burkholderiales bacterium]|nr:transcriptional regulator GcvA [Burkholderiales bacterium]
MPVARLPSLDLLRGFEAAARHLSFTKAAAELHVTQSAVSRQIKTLEGQLGVSLFRRFNRALLLTEAGQSLLRAVTPALGGIEHAVARLSAIADDRPVTLTTTISFAALWLIPRLAQFRAVHPDADVRLDANNDFVDLARGGIDLAVRFCEPRAAPAGAVPLIGEEVFPVASPRLARNRKHPLKVAADLAHHVLLHYEDPRDSAFPWLTWREWLQALKVPDLKPAGALRFNHYDQLVRAAIEGEGVALGRAPLIERVLNRGELIAPFRGRVTVGRKYFVIVAPVARERAHVQHFVEWLLAEAASGNPVASGSAVPHPGEKPR